MNHKKLIDTPNLTPGGVFHFELEDSFENLKLTNSAEDHTTCGLKPPNIGTPAGFYNSNQPFFNFNFDNKPMESQSRNEENRNHSVVRELLRAQMQSSDDDYGNCYFVFSEKQKRENRARCRTSDPSWDWEVVVPHVLGKCEEFQLSRSGLYNRRRSGENPPASEKHNIESQNPKVTAPQEE